MHDVTSRSTDEVPTWAAVASAVGALGVLAYVASWLTAGVLTPGYDATRQAISELFALGAPPAPRWLVGGALAVTGLLLVVAGPALHRGLPGEDLTGSVLVTVSGVATVAVAFLPCTQGCPGYGTSFTDTAHTVTAGIGYAALITAPVAFGLRMRGHDDRFARLSVVLGLVAITGFVVRYGGLYVPYGGLQQRVMNTVADAWYVLAAVVVVRRWRDQRAQAGTA